MASQDHVLELELSLINHVLPSWPAVHSPIKDSQWSRDFSSPHEKIMRLPRTCFWHPGGQGLSPKHPTIRTTNLKPIEYNHPIMEEGYLEALMIRCRLRRLLVGHATLR